LKRAVSSAACLRIHGRGKNVILAPAFRKVQRVRKKIDPSSAVRRLGSAALRRLHVVRRAQRLVASAQQEDREEDRQRQNVAGFAFANLRDLFIKVNSHDRLPVRIRAG
jgi:hypothetical protein